MQVANGPARQAYLVTNFIPFPLAVTAALANGTFPDLAALFPPTDSFLNQSVRSVLVEAPVEVTGFRRLHYWATTAIYDQGHRTWLQLQRAGGPNTTTFWDFINGSAKVNINATVPLDDIAGRPAKPDTDPASGVWGQVRDQTAAVVKAGGTFNEGIHGRSTPLAYGAWVADTLLPNVIPFIPGTNALWDPWQGSHNGKGLREDAFDNVTKVVLNQDFVPGLTQPAPLLDYFPYLPPRRKADPSPDPRYAQGADDRGGAAGDVQPAVDVLQVLADGAFGDAEPPGDLRVGVPGSGEVQQLPLPGCEIGARLPPSFGVEIGLMQVRAEQGEQRAVRLAEVTA